MGRLSRQEKEAFLFGDLDKTVAEFSKEDFEEIQEERNDVIEAYSTSAGQRVFLELIGATYLFDPYSGQNASSYAKEGKREMGLYYMKLLGPEAFMDLYNQASQQFLPKKKQG